jgi:uncharacterized phage-associated protein
METGHDSRAVANEILLIGQEKGIPMSMMKLIKLVYFAHGATLAITGNPLSSEQPEAWKYGPVFRTLYRSLPNKGAEPVSYPIPIPIGAIDVDISFTDVEKTIMSRIVDQFGPMGAFQLSDITHKEDSPWTKIYKEKGAFTVIPNEMLKPYFEGLINATK